MTLLLATATFLISTNATPREVVETCREMIPSDVEITGRIVMRNRRGVVVDGGEHDYRLVRTAGVTSLTVDGKPFDFASQPSETRLMGTDVTASDIRLDYLWWDEFSFDAEREGETVNGQVCSVIVMKKGDRAVRVWVDRKTGAMMQAEELKNGEPHRRLWGTRIKKFGERWMANVMEVETFEGEALKRTRTKIIVETLK